MLLCDNPRGIFLSLILLFGIWIPCVYSGIPELSPRFEHYLQEDGLSQNAIMCSMQDADGYLWFGTQDGLNRFDGYRFEHFLADSQPNGLSGQHIRALFQDHEGMIWIGSFANGADRYDPGTGAFTNFRHNPARADSLSGDHVVDMTEDRSGRMWFATFDAGVCVKGEGDRFRRFSFLTSESTDHTDDMMSDVILGGAGHIWAATKGRNIYRINPDNGEVISYAVGVVGSGIRQLLLSKSGFIWVGDEQGLYKLDPVTGSWEEIRLPGQVTEVRAMFEEADGTLWLGAYNRGLLVYDPGTGETRHYPYRPVDPTGLTTQAVTTILKDSSNAWWFGTFGGGLCKWTSDTARFALYRHDPLDPFSLSHNFIRGLFEDHRGLVWVGTSGGGVSMLDPVSGRFTRFAADPGSAEALNHNSVFTINQGPDLDLWIGTGDGLHRMNYQTGAIRRYLHDPADPKTLRANQVMSTAFDSNNKVWVATRGGGLTRLDLENDCMEHFRHDPANPATLPDDRVSTVVFDQSHRLWVGLETGLSRLEREDMTFTHFRHDPNRPDTLSNNRIFGMTIDDLDPDVMWIGTAGGLNRMDLRTERVRSWLVRDGLPNRVVYGVLMDPPDRIWMSTNGGLAVMDLKTERFRVYNMGDGLQMDEFNQNALFRSNEGRMFFGGLNGFNSFFPGDITDDPAQPPIRITNFRIANVPITVNTPNSPLSTPIDRTKELVLDHQRNMFSFEFAALHFARPEKNRYAYMMEGLDSTWIQTSADNRRAAYTTLPSGDYVFRVKGSNKDGVWNEQGASIAVRILPAPWLSWWAKTLYALLVIGMLLWYLGLQRDKLEHQRQIAEKDRRLAEQERRTADRLRQVDKLKDDFLANTSHELRTPLNGIIGLAESLIDGATGPLPEVTKANLAMVVSSGKRLANLVNDILDFSKLRNQNLHLQPAAVDFRALTEVVLALSRPLVGGKPVTLNNRVSPNLAPVWADENRLQQIMHNLIGNAVKFTESGYVTVAADLLDGKVAVSVIDSGIGISEDKLDLIFDSFEQVDGSMVRGHSGTGLGLAVTRQLVQLHGGSIEVRSVVGEGTTFTFYLPAEEGRADQSESPKPAAARLVETLAPLEDTETRLSHGDEDGSAFNILIVDDEPVNRQVLVNHLTLRKYRVREAVDGPEALRIIRSGETFDLVLLDLMMPGMSGYEVCEMLREEYPVQDLPVIFLTAKNGVTDLVSGFHAGANDYLTKPVAKDELLARVRVHLELLDVNRNLEEKVEERTNEIHSKNEEIMRAQRRLMVQDKLVSLGRMTAGIAHELQNPLNFVSNFTQASVSLLGELSDLIGRDDVRLSPGVRDEIEDLVSDLNINGRRTEEHGKRAAGIVKSMMTLSEARDQKATMTHLNSFVTEFAGIAFKGARDKCGLVDLELVIETDPGIGEVQVFPQSMTRVLVNLINNAVESMAHKEWGEGERPQLKVTTALTEGRAVIEVADNGHGIPEDLESRIYNPFFTTRSPGSGNIGLGLTICYDVVFGEHGGELVLDSEPMGGAVFRVCLPLQ